MPNPNEAWPACRVMAKLPHLPSLSLSLSVSRHIRSVTKVRLVQLPPRLLVPVAPSVELCNYANLMNFTPTRYHDAARRRRWPALCVYEDNDTGCQTAYKEARAITVTTSLSFRLCVMGYIFGLTSSRQCRQCCAVKWTTPGPGRPDAGISANFFLNPFFFGVVFGTPNCQAPNSYLRNPKSSPRKRIKFAKSLNTLLGGWFSCIQSPFHRQLLNLRNRPSTHPRTRTNWNIGTCWRIGGGNSFNGCSQTEAHFGTARLIRHGEQVFGTTK